MGVPLPPSRGRAWLTLLCGPVHVLQLLGKAEHTQALRDYAASGQDVELLGRWDRLVLREWPRQACRTPHATRLDLSHCWAPPLL